MKNKVSSWFRSSHPAPCRRRHLEFERLEDRILLSSGKLYVLDPATNQFLPTSSTAPINTFSSWSMSLEAQVVDTSVVSYSWNTSQALDATNVSGQNTYNLQLTWASFSGSVNTDTISLTETNSDGSHITQSYQFLVAGTDDPGWASAPPTSASTWPNVIAPDQLKNEATVAAGRSVRHAWPG